MEHGIELWRYFMGLYRDPCTHIIPTVGPKVCKYYLHWASGISMESLSNSLGTGWAYD